MRTVLVILMLLPMGIVVATMFLLYAQLRGFRRAVPRLANSVDMGRFKRMAAFQMRVTNFVLPLTALPAIVWVCGKFFAGSLGWLDLLVYVLVPLAIPFVCSGLMIGTARSVRATPTADAALEAERDRVARVWVHERWPDW